jgi:acetyl esterase/lipase
MIQPGQGIVGRGLLARERGGPALSHQVLLYPATDLAQEPTAQPGSLFIDEAEMRAYHQHYVGDADPRDPRLSPLLASDHSRLPPALIQVGEHDPLRDGGVRYAAALRAAGVPVRLTEYVGMPHGYLNFPRPVPDRAAGAGRDMRGTGRRPGPAADPGIRPSKVMKDQPR